MASSPTNSPVFFAVFRDEMKADLESLRVREGITIDVRDEYQSERFAGVIEEREIELGVIRVRPNRREFLGLGVVGPDSRLYVIVVRVVVVVATVVPSNFG